jgi:hypothetical protein
VIGEKRFQSGDVEMINVSDKTRIIKESLNLKVARKKARFA